MDIITSTIRASSSGERGARIGTEQGEPIREAVRLYLDYFASRGLEGSRVREIAETCAAALADWAPGLAEELAATAESAGLEMWQLAAVNARTEVLSVLPPENDGECSTAVYAPSGGGTAQTIQTWDWLHFLAPTGHLVEHVYDDAERSAGQISRVRLFTEPGVLGKIGVNDAGVGVHFNILHHASDRGEGGVPVHAISRRVLDEATSVDHAERIVRSATPSASTVLTVVQAAPGAHRAACFEISPERVSVVRPDAEGWLIHTNNFIAEDQQPGEATRDRSTTYLRLAHLADQRAKMAVQDLPFAERAKRMCGEGGAAAPICCRPSPDDPPHEQWATLLTASLDVEATALDYFAGPPSELLPGGALRFGPQAG